MFCYTSMYKLVVHSRELRNSITIDILVKVFICLDPTASLSYLFWEKLNWSLTTCLLLFSSKQVVKDQFNFSQKRYDRLVHNTYPQIIIVER